MNNICKVGRDCVYLIALLALVFNSLCVCAQFTDFSDMMGDPIINEGSPHGDGISFYDFNYDGWDDLTISNGTADPRFYINNNGTLEPAGFAIPNNPSENISMMLWADYDNDGDADLLITKFGAPVQLWQNDGNFNFTEIAQSAGIWPGSFDHVGAAFADYNHDGCLDLYIAKFYHPGFFPGDEYSGRLYLNNCDGTFTDVTDSSGVHLPPRPCFQPVFLDYNNDGWEDLLLVIDRTSWTNELFRNNGDGTFTNVTAESGFGFPFDAMTGTAGDFDNDGDLDVFLTNNPYYPFGTVLMENNGDGTFSNNAALYGVNLFQVTWGGLWIDCDNDTWQDLLVTITSPVLQPIGNQFFMNNGGQGFTQQNELLGIAADSSESYVCARGDLNNDGYYDFALNNEFPDPSKLYINDGGSNNYLSVSLEGTISNRDGVGTWLHCYVDGEHYVRYTLSGENLIGQNSGKQIFGLGAYDTVDSLVVEWNSGTTEVYFNPETNTHHHLIEGATFSLPFSVEIVGNNYLCPGDSVVLNAGPYDNFLWNTGWEGQYLYVSEPGEYWVTVTNEFGLEVQSVPIQIDNAPMPVLTWSLDHVTCNGLQDGSIWVETSTGPFDEIIWNNGIQLPFIDDLPAGTYSFTGTDSYGCTIEDSAAVMEPDSLVVLPNLSDALCFGEATGIATASASGGTPPYLYNWFGLNPNNLAAGNYAVQVTDWNGCLDSISFSISEPDLLELDITTTDAETGGENGTAELSVSGGTPPYFIEWSTGDFGSNQIENLPAGDYSVIVTDFNECSESSEFSIQLLTGISAIHNNPIQVYPNPFSDFIKIEQCAENHILVRIRDLTGRTIMDQTMVSCPSVLELSHLSPGSYLFEFDEGLPPILLEKYGW